MCRACGGHFQVTGDLVVGVPPGSEKESTSAGDTGGGLDYLGPVSFRDRALRWMENLKFSLGSPLKKRFEAAAGGAQKEDGKRTAVCFDCLVAHEVGRAAESTQCPGCGAYIDLRDIEITDRSHQRIRTRGSVVVHPKAVLASPGILCGDLTVYGQISGSVHASGTVTFRTDGKVLGEIHCQKFVIEKRCRIQFLSRLYCREAVVNGSMVGDICCRDQLSLADGATIDGAVLAGKIKMDAGGQINGPMCVLSRANMASIKASPAFKELAATFDFDQD